MNVHVPGEEAGSREGSLETTVITQMTMGTCLQGQREAVEKEPFERQEENQESRSIQRRKDVVLKVSNIADLPEEKEAVPSGLQKASLVLVRTTPVPR